MSPEELGHLSSEVENYIELSLGRKLPYVGILFDPKAGKLAMFTNRRSNQEVRQLLEEALAGLKRASFRVMGEGQEGAP